MPLIDGLVETKSAAEWLDLVFSTAIANGWTDLKVRYIRDKNISALGQGGEDARLVLRARINRQERDVAVLSGSKATSILTIIKSNSGISTGDAIEPLDGLYPYTQATVADGETPKKLDVRVAVYPTYVGETITLRLPSTGGTLTLDELRFTAHNRELLERALGLSNGLIIVAGPMNSGKSTTLRTILGELGSEEMSVWAVEDPVEVQIEGVEQISINAGAGASWRKVLTGLRRSDLEVLMIAEMRNADESAAALEIGNAGAKVLSTIHANDSVGAVMQLMELSGAKPHTLGNQLRTVISQRLLRTLCTACGGQEPAQQACETCSGSGFGGVRPIHEILLLTEDFIHALANNAPAGELRAVAQRNGMRTLRETAQEALDAGETTIDEVQRVLGHD